MKSSELCDVTEGVLMTARFRGAKSITSQSCGLRFNDFIITSGLILEPFMFLRLVEHLQRLKRNPGHTYVTRDTIEEYRLKLPTLYATLPTQTINQGDVTDIVEHRCEILLIWNVSSLQDIIKSNLARWKVLPETGENSSEDRLELASTFLVARIYNPANRTASPAQRLEDTLVGLMSDLADICEPHIQRGSQFVSISTPFFLKHFLNSWHQGIVSNLLGWQECLMLVDVDLPPQSEGAVLLSKECKASRRNLVGMIITSWCQFEGEQIGFCLAVNFKSLVQDFLRKHKPNYIWRHVMQDDLSFLSNKNQLKDIIGEHLDACTALIKTRQSWGTGAVISLSPALILTCSHVVSQKQDICVTIGNCRSSAKVIYSTPLGQVYDLAVLSFVPNEYVRKFRIASVPPKFGEPVYVVGFPLFKSTKPSVSNGIVSHMTKLSGPMLTSCCLHSGGSGAPLIRPDGSLLGIMTSFVCSTEISFSNFPRLSIAVASMVFGPCLETFLDSGDKKSFLPLTSNDPEINKLWTLSSPSLLKCHL